MSDERETPALMTHQQVYLLIGETQKADYRTWACALRNHANPVMALMHHKLSYNQPCSAVLENPRDTFIPVRSADRKHRSYRCDMDDGDIDDFGEEQEPRHPGTNYESDDEDERLSHTEEFSPVTTKAGFHVSAVAFAGAGSASCEMRSAYPLQLSIRTDDKRRCLNYDFYEFKRPILDQGGNLPPLRDVKLYWKVMDMEPNRCDASDDEESDLEDSFYDDPVEPEEGSTFSEGTEDMLRVQGMAGAFLHSRVLRFRVSLDDVVGARLQTTRSTCEEAGDEDVPAVLVLEMDQRPGQQSPFCARRVHSSYQRENAWTEIEDWTVNQVASKASRHYIFGNLEELRQLAAHLTVISDSLGKLMKDSASSTNNTLKPPVSLSYAAAPDFREEERASKKAKPNTKYKMTVEQVNDLFKAKGFSSDNLCLKRGVLCGHIVIDQNTTKETVLFKGNCSSCGQTVVCTFGDALDQPCYAGLEYEDGGENGAVQCEGEDCPGMYLTGFCTGDPDLDSGKFHNHCTECPDFGVCIGDYREAHCEDCGNHYFRGLPGFTCTHCGSSGRGGGSKSKPLSELPPPPLSTWDGQIEGARESFEEFIRRNPATMRFILAV